MRQVDSTDETTTVEIADKTTTCGSADEITIVGIIWWDNFSGIS